MPELTFKARGPRCPGPIPDTATWTRHERGPTQGMLGVPGARPSGTRRDRLAAMTHRTDRGVFDQALATGEVRKGGAQVDDTTREESA